jgi:branched-chain amino acid transport system substrate-binding protein
VFPDPHRARTPVVRDYQAAMQAIGRSDFSSASLEGYINTRILAEGLDRAGRDVTRAKLRTALLSLNRFDLGGFSVDYAGAAPFVGSRFVSLGILGGDGRFLG